MLFNPRQLLMLSILSKILNNIAEKLKSRDGEFGAAVALYLAFSINKIASYNNIATQWNIPKGTITHIMRGESSIDFRQEYCEVKRPERSLEWTLEPHIAESSRFTKTTGGILPVLRFLCNELHTASTSNLVTVFLADSTKLSKILGINVVDVVNVDPPYFEQVIYSDRSELYWVILRRCLSPVLELLFKQGLKLKNWHWSFSSLPREREMVSYSKKDKRVGRGKKSIEKNSSIKRYENLLQEFIMEVNKVLKDDGTLVLWFTHPTDLAWRAIGKAFYNAGYIISKVWPIQTEYKLRFKRQWNLIAQEMSLIIVARKYSRKTLFEIGARNIKMGLLNNPEFIRVARSIVEEARNVAREASASPADTAALLFGSALSVATRFEIPGVKDFNLIYEPAVTIVVREFIEPLIGKITLETGPVKLNLRDSRNVVELVASAMLRNPAARSYITLWMLSRVDLDNGITRDVPLALSYDFAQTTAKLCGYDFEKLREMGLLGETIASEAEEMKGQKKGKAYYPYFFETLSAARAQVTWNKLSLLIPGKAIYLAYLALTESGAPAVRAKSIRNRLYTWSERETAEASALAIILLETARDIDLGYKPSKVGTLEKFFIESKESTALVAREIAIKTLLYLLPKI